MALQRKINHFFVQYSIVRWGEEYHFDIFIPHVYVEGTYNIDGKIILLPIKGAGKFTGNFSKSTAIETLIVRCYYISELILLATTSGSVKCFLTKHSSVDENVHIQKFDIKIKLGSGSITLHNLFNGDKFLGKIRLRFSVNEKNLKNQKIAISRWRYKHCHQRQFWRI